MDLKKYLNDFLNRSKSRPFYTNLKRYSQLTYFQKLKVVSSFYTHLVIDSEKNIDNKEVREDILSILNKMELYKQDNFLEWLSSNLDIKRD